MQQGLFLAHYSLANLMTNLVRILTDMSFDAYVGISPPSEITGFENYQTCPEPLKRVHVHVHVAL